MNGSLTRPDTQMRSNANDTNFLSSIEHVVSNQVPTDIPFVYSNCYSPQTEAENESSESQRER